MHTYKLILLLFVGAFSHSSEGRTVYVIPDDNDLQGLTYCSCPADHCYSLQDVLSNSSYFFDSYTTLELLTGMYNITEKVGQLILVNIENFILRGSSPNVTITCQPGATFGITIVQSQKIEISSIQISHCSAKLQLQESSSTILKAFNEQATRYLEYNLNSCDTNGNNYPACYTSLASFRNQKVIIYKTAILHSKGVGVFNLDSGSLDISESLFAYNQINCINFVLDTTSTTFNMSQSQINFGQTNSRFASGLNLFVNVRGETHSIQLTNISLANNRGVHGNFYMAVSTTAGEFDYKIIDMNITIINITSVQTMIAAPGILVKYMIDLKDGHSNMCYLPGRSPAERCTGTYSFLYDPDCNLKTLWNAGRSTSKEVHIILLKGYFTGSCVTIMDSETEILAKLAWFKFEMNNITINESMCPTALSIVNSNIASCMLSDVTIINSYNNILLASNTRGTMTLTGNTSFLTNQGSVLLSHGKIEFSDYVLISGNIAHEYESILQVSDSSKALFKGEVRFLNNTGRQGGAILAYGSNLNFEGNINFIGNMADNGGAITLKEGAMIRLNDDTYVTFIANSAKKFGGAIYIEDTGLLVRRKEKCFIHVSDDDYCNVQFENNSAGIAGAALFGGWIDFCKMESGVELDNILEFKDENSVSSNPTRVCMCTNSTLNKNETEAHIEVIPGQIFEIEVVAVGQRFGVVPASVRVETDRNNVIEQLQKLQDTEITALN